MKPVVLDSEAAKELRDAIAFYNRRREGLGDRFSDEVEATLDVIERRPRAQSIHTEDFRKRRVPKPFPYTVYFVEYDDHVWIAAVYHDKRKPDAWMSRRPDDVS